MAVFSQCIYSATFKKLDEIGEMSLAPQAKILRILQEGELERVGGSETINVDVRLIAATHKDLQSMITQETFRQDLFFRLSVVPLHLPPLRDRSIDIPELAQFFPEEIRAKTTEVSSSEKDFTLRDMEREIILVALEKNNQNKILTAKRLGIARQTLLNKLKEYGIS